MGVPSASGRGRRRRQSRSSSPDKNDPFSISSREPSSNEPYVPYVSAAKRLRMEREGILSAIGGGGARGRKILNALSSGLGKSGGVQSSPSKDGGEGSRSGTDAPDASARHPSDDASADEAADQAESLLDAASALHAKLAAMTEMERADAEANVEENRLLKEASKVTRNALQGAAEMASGTVYTSSLLTSWVPPRYIVDRPESENSKTREQWHILVEGPEVPPPVRSFCEMKFPKPVLDYLSGRNIRRPTPIQMQGLPVALSGRDMVGIAFTGSGKTMAFGIPLVMAALEEECKMPIIGGEGPIGVALAPSRELARQTYEQLEALCAAISGAEDGMGGRYPRLRAQLLIGGEDKRAQLDPIRESGVHCIAATPGRLRDFLGKKSINMDICRYICLDEADRMLDLGFDEEVGEIMNHFNHQRQTLLFSATFPKKFQDFAKNTLVRPIVVNVGRAGAANLDVIQEVEYVKQEAKIIYLLECLQKTAPPVIIFCEKKGDVDDIHEYLLLKGVEAVSIHGGKGQDERNEAIKSYKEGNKDVLVATDIAAKGLDFADIQHVINFDMPPEIENYVHRIGRTGRCGKTGVATTFINKSCEETTLLDLKHLLVEAHQRVPPVLMIMDDPLERRRQEANAEGKEGTGSKGCSFCGGLGHSIIDCPKIDKDARRVASGHKDAIAGGDW